MKKYFSRASCYGIFPLYNVEQTINFKFSKNKQKSCYEIKYLFFALNNWIRLDPFSQLQVQLVMF